nr:hypothetical protein [Candidatus Freyrarchaeum guaymaensis]
MSIVEKGKLDEKGDFKRGKVRGSSRRNVKREPYRLMKVTKGTRKDLHPL